MSFHQTLLYILIIFLIYSCGNTTASKPTEDIPTLDYFDLKGFIKSEIARLSQKSSFSKTAYVNGDKETNKFNKINLQNELKPFSDSDINKPSWIGKYNADSTFNEKNELIRLYYQAKDDKLKTKTLAIDFIENDVSKITIENATSSSVANTFQTLIYHSNKGFSIESKQDVSLMEENNFKIEVTFQ